MDREQYRAAWMTSYLLSAWSKDAPSPEKLLGKAFIARMRARGLMAADGPPDPEDDED